MDKAHLGLISTIAVILIAAFFAGTSGKNKLKFYGIAAAVSGGLFYVLIDAFEIPIFLKHSTVEGGDSAEFMLWLGGIGVIVILVSRLFDD